MDFYSLSEEQQWDGVADHLPFWNVILTEARAERSRGEGKGRILMRRFEPRLSTEARQTFVVNNESLKVLRVALASHAQLALAQDDN